MITDIREAGTGDALAIADLHIESWRVAYQGILPRDYLAHTIVAERRDYWRQALESLCSGDFVLVLPGSVGLLGFIGVLRGREPGYDALIDNLHVQPGHTGQGLGRRLLGAAAGRLLRQGMESACLWVFDDNLPTVRFYQRLGGLADQRGTDPFAGAHKPHTRYGWRDLAGLRDACRQHGG